MSMRAIWILFGVSISLVVVVILATFIVGDIVFGGSTTLYGELTWAASPWALLFILLGTGATQTIFTVRARRKRRKQQLANLPPWQYQR